MNSIQDKNESSSAECLYRQEVQSFRQLDRQERARLVSEIQTVEDRNRFAEHNLPLVTKIARDFWFKCQRRTTGLDFLDLVQEGNIGLLEAIERFDPTKGCQFSSYAFHWIRQRIIHLLNNSGRAIRIPNGEMLFVLRYEKVKARLEEKLDRKASPGELARKMRVRVKQIRQCEEHLKVLTLESLDALLDESKYDEESGSFSPDSIHDRSTPSPFDLLAVQEVVEYCASATAENIAALRSAGVAERDITIYRIRHEHAPDESPKTFREIGEMFDLTRQAIQQTYTKLERIIALQRH